MNLLSEKAQLVLQKQLINQLACICSASLMDKFQKFRATGNEMRDFLLIKLKGNNSKQKYHEFLETLLSDGFLSLFQEYCVLGKLTSIAIDYWVESTVEFIKRLATDWQELEKTFATDKPLKEVADLSLGLSDSHDRGRSVISLKFNTELKLIYKPRTVSLDVAFYNFLHWCNSISNTIPLKIMKILDKSNYGWLEYIEFHPCQDQNSVKSFYQRSGMLIAIVYALEGTDFHFENLIANGEYPILIDLEGLLQNRIKCINENKKNAVDLGNNIIYESVLRTALIPISLEKLNKAYIFNLGGVGIGEEKTVKQIKIQNINTDGMGLEIEEYILKKDANIPVLNNLQISPKNYIEDIVSGFQRIYNLLLSHKEILLTNSSPLMEMSQQKARYLFRNTNTYSKILANSYSPYWLTSGIKRSIALDVLSRAFIAMKNNELFLPILRKELETIEQMDIPCFVSNTSTNNLEISQDNLSSNFFEESSFQMMLNKLKNLDQNDLILQSDIIYNSFYSQFITENNTINLFNDSILNLDKQQNLSSGKLLKEAIFIAENLQNLAIYGSDGGLTWLGFNYKNKSQNFHFPSLEFGLYDGTVGISLFLSALAKVTKNPKWYDLALRSLQNLQEMFKNSYSNADSQAKLFRQLGIIGINGTQGIASIIYSFVKISFFLEEPSLLEDANKIASLITLDLINADREYNIMEGVAGIILGLINLYEANSVNNTSQSNILTLLVSCGEHLLKIKNKDTSNFKLLTGFSEGLAGIAYALLRLFAITQDYRFLEAATEAISYENSLFSIEANNWPDLRTEKPVFRVNWAHGASGIALARLGSLSYLDTEQMHTDIAIALETTQKYCLGDSDNLCWGNFGCLETILVASQKLNRPDLMEFSQPIVNHLITQAHSKGNFSLFSNLPTVIHNPSFFHGTSGIGYELLRFAYPDLLPSVLLWE